jgi:hypothetical protein
MRRMMTEEEFYEYGWKRFQNFIDFHARKTTDYGVLLWVSFSRCADINGVTNIKHDNLSELPNPKIEESEIEEALNSLLANGLLKNTVNGYVLETNLSKPKHRQHGNK